MRVLLFYWLCYFHYAFANHFRNLDDSILFPINWAGYNGKPELLDSPDYETLTLISADQEEFQCLFPLKYGELEDDSGSYKGPGPLSLLLPILRKNTCSQKFEPYWSYDVCHGDKVLQYHRELDGSTSKQIQQYILGRITADQLQKLEIVAAIEDKSLPRSSDIAETKVEGSSVPYYAVTYAGGSVCELTGSPRVTRVLYVCLTHGRNDVYSVKETSTCEYEITVLTDVLCQHPLYRKRELPESPVHCLAAAPGARRPRELLKTEAHSLKLKIMPHAELTSDPESGAVGLGKIDADFENVKLSTGTKDEDDEDELDDDNGFGSYTYTRRAHDETIFPDKPLTRDQSAVQAFLSGEDCLDGGVGWWQYEFCYGRHVTQFHQNRDGSRHTIILGAFDEQKHINWIKKYPNRAPSNYQVTHWYSEGAVCDVTGKPRTVEVRLKCYPPSKGYGVSTVALWLMEPEPCRYVLGVETGMVCDLLAEADEYGLFRVKQTNDPEGTTSAANGSTDIADVPGPDSSDGGSSSGSGLTEEEPEDEGENDAEKAKDAKHVRVAKLFRHDDEW